MGGRVGMPKDFLSRIREFKIASPYITKVFTVRRKSLSGMSITYAYDLQIFLLTRHFRVALNLIVKARLSAKFNYENYSFHSNVKKK